MELALLERLTQKSHSRVWFRTSKWSAGRSYPHGPSRPGHSLPSQVRYGKDSSICDLHPQPNCSQWRQLWPSPGHHHLPHSLACPSNLQRFQEARYYLIKEGRYFKKPELRFSCYFGGIPLEDNEAELKDANKTPHVIICTPGRLYDLSKHKLIQF